LYFVSGELHTGRIDNSAGAVMAPDARNEPRSGRWRQQPFCSGWQGRNRVFGAAGAAHPPVHAALTCRSARPKHIISLWNCGLY